MKRSTKLALVSVAGVAAVIAYSWYGNDAEAEMDSDIYTSVSDCVSSGKDEATCKARFGEALDAYAKTAPRFANKQDCEKDFGAAACMAVPPSVAGEKAENGAPVASTGSGYFMPIMMGFLAGRMMQGMQPAPAAPLYGCASGMAAAGSSCYSSNSGRSYYAYSGGGGGGSRTVRTPVSEFRNTSTGRGFTVIPGGGSYKSTVASRGGFGSTGRGFSSGGFGG